MKITGKVIKGDGYGKKIGFPTVNLDIGGLKLPAEGVYAGNAILEGKTYRAGIIIGPERKAEGHIIGFSADVYGKEVTLETENFLREYKKFDTEEELIEQIKKDLNQC